MENTVHTVSGWIRMWNFNPQDGFTSKTVNSELNSHSKEWMNLVLYLFKVFISKKQL